MSAAVGRVLKMLPLPQHIRKHTPRKEKKSKGRFFSPEEHFRVLRQKDPERPKAEVLGVFQLPTCYFGNQLKFSLCLE